MQLKSDYTYDSNSISVIDRNASSLNASIRSKGNFLDENVRIQHLYIEEKMNFPSVEENRYEKVYYESKLDTTLDQKYISEEDRKKLYSGEEDEILCGRFPHLNYCGCVFPCSLILDKIKPIEVIPNIYVGSIECAYKTRELLGLKITHILNLSCTEYNKRRKYFTYLDIYINDNHTENAIKFFKITNRFIDEAVKQDKNILIHSVQGKSRCWVFLIAYLIGRKNYKFHEAMEIVNERFTHCESNDNFYTQLKHYDLETNK